MQQMVPWLIGRYWCQIFCCLLLSACQNERKNSSDWQYYGGDAAGTRYSELTQINKRNAGQLRIAWKYDTDEDSAKNGLKRNIEIQCQPIIIDGVLYGLTPLLKLFALNAATGAELWKFDPFAGKEPRLHPARGVAYWESGEDKRILYTAGPHLFAVDAKTGTLIGSFGSSGIVDLHEGLSHDSLEHDVTKLSVNASTPGIIYKNNFIIGSSVSERGDAAPGYIRAFDVLTGKLKWVFRTIPLPGEPGYETWEKDAYKRFGGANSWAGMVLDNKRGAVYLGTGSPSSDFYGGHRKGQNLFANCVISLNAETGKMNWYYQVVAHDLWDRDMPCAPNLVTVTHNRKRIDAVVQTTKDGLVYVLDRDSGKSLFPVQEVDVPTNGLPGEQPWPKQKSPIIPKPFSRQVLTTEEITDRTPEAYSHVLKTFRKTRSGNKYMPPSIEGTLYFGIGGGAEWGGNASDPQGILYQNSNEMVWNVQMIDMKEATRKINSEGSSIYARTCAPCHGVDRKGAGAEFPSLDNIGSRMTGDMIAGVIRNGRGRMPSFQHLPYTERNAVISFLLNKKDANNREPEKDTAREPLFPYNPPYILKNGLVRFFDHEGYPAIKPPWGTLNAIDLNSGEYLWKIPLGEFPELTKKGIPKTGTENYGGPIVTAGGLVFIAATKDERIRAFDKDTGNTLWEFQLPAGGFATPATYMVNGKQYVVIAAGGVKNGHKPGGEYIAFALP